MPRDRRQGEKTGKIEVEELRPLLIVVRVLFYMWCCTCGAVLVVLYVDAVCVVM